MNYSAKNVFIESHGLLSGFDIILYPINQSLKLYCIQIQMGGTYTMVQLAGPNVVLYKWAGLIPWYNWQVPMLYYTNGQDLYHGTTGRSQCCTIQMGRTYTMVQLAGPNVVLYKWAGFIPWYNWQVPMLYYTNGQDLYHGTTGRSQCCTIQMGRTYTMVQLAGPNVVLYKWVGLIPWYNWQVPMLYYTNGQDLYHGTTGRSQCCTIQMGGTYTMVQLAGPNVVLYKWAGLIPWYNWQVPMLYYTNGQDLYHGTTGRSQCCTIQMGRTYTMVQLAGPNVVLYKWAGLIPWYNWQVPMLYYTNGRDLYHGTTGRSQCCTMQMGRTYTMVQLAGPNVVLYKWAGLIPWYNWQVPMLYYTNGQDLYHGTTGRSQCCTIQMGRTYTMVQLAGTNVVLYKWAGFIPWYNWQVPMLYYTNGQDLYHGTTGRSQCCTIQMGRTYTMVQLAGPNVVLYKWAGLIPWYNWQVPMLYYTNGQDLYHGTTGRSQCCTIQMGGTYTMVQLAGPNVVLYKWAGLIPWYNWQVPMLYYTNGQDLYHGTTGRSQCCTIQMGRTYTMVQLAGPNVVLYKWAGLIPWYNWQVPMLYYTNGRDLYHGTTGRSQCCTMQMGRTYTMVQLAGPNVVLYKWAGLIPWYNWQVPMLYYTNGQDLYHGTTGRSQCCTIQMGRTYTMVQLAGPNVVLYKWAGLIPWYNWQVPMLYYTNGRDLYHGTTGRSQCCTIQMGRTYTMVQLAGPNVVLYKWVGLIPWYNWQVPMLYYTNGRDLYHVQLAGPNVVLYKWAGLIPWYNWQVPMLYYTNGRDLYHGTTGRSQCCTIQMGRTYTMVQLAGPNGVL